MSKQNKFTSAMFDKIKDALNKPKDASSSSFANVMKFPAGHTYTLRLLPNLEDPDKTFFAHYVHGWKSEATGQFISTLSLQTFGEPDPITATFWKLIKSENPEEKALGKKIQRKEQWFFNVYVVEDPANPENNGTVKILKVGPQLKEKIDDALVGDSAEEFGARIFDLGPDGANLKIKAEEQGEFVTFKNSRFANVPKINLSDDEIEAIYASVHDLTQVYPVKTYDELQDILNTHVYCNESKTDTPVEVRKPLSNKPTTPVRSARVEDAPVVDDGTDDPDDDIPFLDGQLKDRKTSTMDPELAELLNEFDND